MSVETSNAALLAGSAIRELEQATNGSELEHRELRAAIAALPERQRTILFLRHYADLDYQRIADALDIERGTVAATLHAAHESLRQSMKEGQA